jgi:hypothetical protein
VSVFANAAHSTEPSSANASAVSPRSGLNTVAARHCHSTPPLPLPLLLTLPLPLPLPLLLTLPLTVAVAVVLAVAVAVVPT